MEIFSLDGKVAIITGASRGIGQMMAVGLAKAGADIIGVASSKMDHTECLVNQTGRDFFPCKVDLASYKTTQKIIDCALESKGKIDILLNNAGVNKRESALDLSADSLDYVMAINFKTPLFLAREVAKYFIENKVKGKIVNTISLVSYRGGFNTVAYCASKSALLGVTKTLCNELAPYDINVNAIAPGFITTDLNADLRRDEVANEAIIERIPMQRWGKPADLVGAAVFLSSAASDYINGSAIAIDGGWLAR